MNNFNDDMILYFDITNDVIIQINNPSTFKPTSSTLHYNYEFFYEVYLNITDFSGQLEVSTIIIS
jgi:hypothetical protein